MFKLKKNHFLFFWLLIAGLFAQAQHGGAVPEGKALPEKEFSGQQNEKWVEIQKSLLELKVKVDAQKVIVADLLKAKKNNESKISQEEIAQLKKEHERLQSLTNDYNQILVDFQFRFPEKGLESGRKYMRLENQSIEEMENAPTIQGRLKKINKKIKKQYSDEPATEEAAVETTLHHGQKKPKSAQNPNTDKATTPDVTEQIILVK